MYNPEPHKQGYIITLFIDNQDSWITPWARKLQKDLARYHTIRLCHKKNEILKGDFNFLLGCTTIIEKHFLKLNSHNLVIHESDLPKGKGWSPVSWQVLEGVNEIPVTMFEATEQLDAGAVYLKDKIILEGHELLPRIKEKQGEKTLDMIYRFLSLWPDLAPVPQAGEESLYDRRTIDDDMLDINKTIAEQFNNLRIADNTNHPAWFKIYGKRYRLEIYPYSKKESK